MMEESFHELQKFLVRNVVRSRRELGVGAHGSVEELQADGMIYAGKKIHDALVELGNNAVAQRFVKECQLMSDLRHPHVVQFIGVCFLAGSRLPVLVMEYLPGNLDYLLETTPKIPLFLKRSILHDVALGLVYLHSHVPPIIHRDLTARNVLLNSEMRAKIADFGVARILNLQPGSRTTMTQAPGNFTYMPPEALCTKPTYDVKIDIFSFGHLALFTLTQVFPNLLPPTYTSQEDPGRIVGRSEAERRSHEVDLLYRQLGEQHPLVQLVLACLQNRPELRPSTQQVVEILQSAKSGMVDPYSHLSRLQLLQVVDRSENEIADLRKKLESKEAELDAKEAMVEHYREDYSELQLQIRENRLSSKLTEDKDVDCDATNVSDAASLPTPEDKLMQQKGKFKQKVEKYNKRIIEAVQSLIQQLRTQKRDQKHKESEPPSSDPISVEDTSSKELADKPLRSETATLALSPHSEVLSWKGRELTVKCSNIAKEKADIIVVCNNTLLIDDGGGVYGAVNRESLGILEENCSKYIRRCGPVEVGHTALTKAGGNLRCKWVIHAVGPDNHYFPDTCRALLSQAVRETLKQAEQLKAVSVAFPAISTGEFGVSQELSAEAMINAILDYKFSEGSTLLDIRIVIISHYTYSCFAKHLVLKRS